MHRQEEVIHRTNRVGRRIDRHLDGVFEIAANQVSDVAVECCREQHCLMRSGDLAQNPLNLRGEPIVGHAIGLVEYEHFDLIEIEFVVFQQVDEAQWSGHNNLDAGVEYVDLTMAR